MTRKNRANKKKATASVVAAANSGPGDVQLTQSSSSNSVLNNLPGSQNTEEDNLENTRNLIENSPTHEDKIAAAVRNGQAENQELAAQLANQLAINEASRSTTQSLEAKEKEISKEVREYRAQLEEQKHKQEKLACERERLIKELERENAEFEEVAARNDKLLAERSDTFQNSAQDLAQGHKTLDDTQPTDGNSTSSTTSTSHIITHADLEVSPPESPVLTIEHYQALNKELTDQLAEQALINDALQATVRVCEAKIDEMAWQAAEDEAQFERMFVMRNRALGGTLFMCGLALLTSVDLGRMVSGSWLVSSLPTRLLGSWSGWAT